MEYPVPFDLLIESAVACPPPFKDELDDGDVDDDVELLLAAELSRVCVGEAERSKTDADTAAADLEVGDDGAEFAFTFTNV